MEKIVEILSGLPGSGKSYYAKKFVEDNPHDYTVCSSDIHMMVRGKYDFKIERLPETHKMCLQDYVRDLEDRVPHIFVDNTNLHAWEVAPYYRLAEIYGYKPVIVRFNTPLHVCLERQTHGVPLEQMALMYAAFRKPDFPPFWNKVDYEVPR